jgi:hypothetical protein
MGGGADNLWLCDLGARFGERRVRNCYKSDRKGSEATAENRCSDTIPDKIFTWKGSSLPPPALHLAPSHASSGGRPKLFGGG